MSDARPGEPLLTLVLLASDLTDDEVVAAVVAARSGSGPAPAVLVGARPEAVAGLVDRLRAEGLDDVRCVATEGERQAGRLLAHVRTRYWSLALPAEGSPPPGSLVEALEAQPAAVLAHRAGGPGDGGPVLLDGRQLARQMVETAADLLGPAGSVVVRTAALGAEAARWRPPEGARWYLVLWLHLLLRGHVWREAVPEAGPGARPGAAAPPGPTGTADDPAGAWDALAGEARRLGVVEAVASGGPSPAHDARLPLHALVLAEPGGEGPGPGGWSTAVATARRAVPLVRRVTVVARPSASAPPPAPPGVAWRTLDWRSPAVADLFDGAGGDAVLVLAAGEQLEVADERQVHGLLAGAVPGLRADVATPAGREVRLLWPERGAEGDIGAPEGTSRAHALRVTELGGAGDWLDAVASPPAAGRPRPRLRRFAVLAPGFSERSGGIIALHRLCDVLNGLGHDAWIVPADASAATNPSWRTPVAPLEAPVDDDTVVVYPEIISGNPLGARHVVRWLLNRPGRLNGGAPMGEKEHDLLVAFGRQIDPGLPVLALPTFDPTVFFPKDAPGRGRLLWVGKGNLPRDLDRSDMQLITPGWPATKPELAAVLRAADVLVSCDWLTGLNGEALLCGTPVVLAGHQEWSPEDVARNGDPLPGLCFEDGPGPDLEEARHAVKEYHPSYLRRFVDVYEHVEAFVALVNEHFAAG